MASANSTSTAICCGRSWTSCCSSNPTSVRNTNFIHTYLTKLAPSADADPSDPHVRQQHLERMWPFVKDLAGTPRTTHSKRTSSMGCSITSDESRPVRSRIALTIGLEAYVKLPRPMPYMEPKYLQSDKVRRFHVNLGQDCLPRSKRSAALLAGGQRHGAGPRLPVAFSDPATLPPDAVRLDDEIVIVQDVEIKPKNTKFQRQVFYSATQQQYYRGPLPAGYDHGDFSANLRALIVASGFGTRL